MHCLSVKEGTRPRRFTLKSIRRCFIVSLFLALGLNQEVLSQQCDRPDAKATDDFFFTASSEWGAVGDVVGVDLWLTIQNVHPGLSAITVVASYDGEAADLLPEKRYSDYFDNLTFLSDFL